MRGAVMGGHIAVLGLKQHLAALVDEDGAERMIAMAWRGAPPRTSAAGASRSGRLSAEGSVIDPDVSAPPCRPIR
jgi:hypothetical protein